ncbi:hypothetical protein LCGC14_2416090, partial [marine sediment metagenome]
GGKWGRHDPPKGLMAGLKPAKPPADGDNDGMPDAWEKAHGLEPRDGADHAKVMPSGYTAIEEYCNDRARRLIEQAVASQK